MAAITRLGPGGYSVAKYGTFLAAPPYTPPPPPGEPITRLGSGGYGVGRLGTMVAAPAYEEEIGDFNYLIYARKRGRR